MKVKIITLALLTLTVFGFTQNPHNKNLFSEAIDTNVDTYNLATDKIDYKLKPKENELIFNDFVNNNIINTYFDNFKAKNLNGALINFNTYFKKPLILTTYATWYIIERKSVSQLNKLAKKHHKNINFAVVFWEKESSVRKKSKVFNRHVKVLYIDERENTFANEINYLKHPLGQSLIYYINKSNRIIDLKKNYYFNPKTNTSYNKTSIKNSNQFISGLNLLLLDENTIASE